MIEYRIGHADLARVRFARSPMQEVGSSIRLLQTTGAHPIHQPWLDSARPRVARLGPELLPELFSNSRFLPDFLLPIPSTVDDEFDLDFLQKVKPEKVRTELDIVWPVLPEQLRPLYDDPMLYLPRLETELLAYWQAVVEPVWPRLKALYEADFAYRSRELALGGVARLFAELHPDIDYTADRVRIRKPQHDGTTLVLRGSGILLVPCAFAWPNVLVATDPDCHPLLTYPPRGIAEVWTPAPHLPETGLTELIGRTRARLLTLLDLPQSTKQLAEVLGMTSANVSQHLSVLQRSGLVTKQRAGRVVLYQRTDKASRLLVD